MGILTPDTSQAQEMTPIEPGPYPSKITAAEPGLSKTSNPKIVVTFSITVNGKERTRTAHIPVTGAGAGGFDALLRATGFTELADQYKDPAFQPKPAFDTDSLIGQTLIVVVDSQLYNNEVRDQLKTYLPM